MAFGESTLGLQRKGNCFWLGSISQAPTPPVICLLSLSIASSRRSHTLTGECRPPLEEQTNVKPCLALVPVSPPRCRAIRSFCEHSPQHSECTVASLVPDSCVGVCVPAVFRARVRSPGFISQVPDSLLWEAGLSTFLDYRAHGHSQRDLSA